MKQSILLILKASVQQLSNPQFYFILFSLMYKCFGVCFVCICAAAYSFFNNAYADKLQICQKGSVPPAKHNFPF